MCQYIIPNRATSVGDRSISLRIYVAKEDSKMRHIRENMFVQFSVTGFLIVVALAVVISVILSSRLNRNVELLADHQAATLAGTNINAEDSISIPSLKRDLGDLRWITIGAVSGGFGIVYLYLVLIVAGGSRTIKRQQLQIEQQATQQVEALNRLLQQRNVLFSEVRGALSVARAHPIFGVVSEYQELVEQMSTLVGPEDTAPLR